MVGLRGNADHEWRVCPDIAAVQIVVILFELSMPERKLGLDAVTVECIQSAGKLATLEKMYQVSPPFDEYVWTMQPRSSSYGPSGMQSGVLAQILLQSTNELAPLIEPDLRLYN
jgi:hypothetical protein